MFDTTGEYIGPSTECMEEAPATEKFPWSKDTQSIEMRLIFKRAQRDEFSDIKNETIASANNYIHQLDENIAVLAKDIAALVAELVEKQGRITNACQS